MKKLFICVSLLVSQISFAEILNSKHEPRHQALIEKAIFESCGLMINLIEESASTEIISVDNGITDKKFNTTILGDFKRNEILEPHTIRVISEYSDMYDHSTQNWGAYAVTSVGCIYNY